MTANSDAPRFVFMLTRDDQTVANARALVGAAQVAGVRHVGGKDIGLPVDELRGLYDDLRAAGCTTYLEVVAESPEAMIRSARAALEVRPDYLIGGTQVAQMAEVIAGSDIQFFPYVGRIVGHPCLLRGTTDEIVADARRAADAGVDGINLLAYRYDGDAAALAQAVVETVDIPVLCAGSIDSAERIAVMRRIGAWGFTVGTAVLDGAFVPGDSLTDQLVRVLSLAAGS